MVPLLRAAVYLNHWSRKQGAAGLGFTTYCSLKPGVIPAAICAGLLMP